MIKPGKIVIDCKVCFEYYKLEKPDKDNFKCAGAFDEFGFNLQMKLYEASKQRIEVSNEYAIGNIYPDQAYIYINEKLRKAKNNQKCKAEVTGDKAIIIELIK